MKTINLIAIVCILTTPVSVMGDTLVKYENGSADVWANIYTKGNQKCTSRSVGDVSGELCVETSKITMTKTVPPDTDPQDYSDVKGGISMSDNLWAAQYDEAGANKKKSDDAIADKNKALQRAYQVKKYGEDAVLSKERSGNSAGSGRK